MNKIDVVFAVKIMVAAGVALVVAFLTTGYPGPGWYTF